MRTRLTLCLAVAMLMATLTACGGDGDQSQPPIVIVMPGGDTQGGSDDSVGPTQTTDGNGGEPEDEGDDNGTPPDNGDGGIFVPPPGGFDLPPVTGMTLVDLDRLFDLCWVCRGAEDRIWDLRLPDDLGTVPRDITRLETVFEFDRPSGVIVGHTWIETAGGDIDVSVVVVLADAQGTVIGRTEPQVWHISSGGQVEEDWTSPVIPLAAGLDAADVVADTVGYSVFQGSGSLEALTGLTHVQWTQISQEIGVGMFQ